jgi:acyl-CoA hydrolase
MTDTAPERLSRPVPDSPHVTSERITPHNANIPGYACGGAIMVMVDTAAATASIDRVEAEELISGVRREEAAQPRRRRRREARQHEARADR